MQLHLMVKIYNSVVLDIGVYITTENDHSCITKYSFYYIASQVLERMDSFVCYVLIQLVPIFFGKDVCSRYLWHTAKGEKCSRQHINAIAHSAASLLFSHSCRMRYSLPRTQ